MKDMILKGTGNSQFLRSIPDFLTQYPTYEDFAQALIAGTFPIDMCGLNEAGLTQVGTALSTMNLLSSDATYAVRTVFGTAPDTPSVAIRMLAQAVQQRATVQTGSYTGTGSYGASSPVTLSFTIQPALVAVYRADGTTYALFFPNQTQTYVMSGYYCFSTMNQTGKTLSWYSTSLAGSLNESGKTYHYLALGTT